MSPPLVIIGCGGFGREVYCLVMALNADGAQPWRFEGFADDSPSNQNVRRTIDLGSACISSVVELTQRSTRFAAVIAVGSPPVRRSIAAIFANTPAYFPNLVHPDATIGREVHLREGAVVAAGARLSTNIVVGRHVQVDQNVTVGHDSRLGHFARLNPHACISGDVDVGDGVLVGANACVLPGLQIGAGAVIGAGACVVRDVGPGVTVKGVPAR